MAFIRKKVIFIVSLFFASCLIIILFSLLLGKILSHDLSLETISEKANLDLRAEGFQHREGVYLASYADGPEVYYKNQNVLALSALNKGVDFIFNYRRSHLDPSFFNQYASILNQKKGAGFWLWKPWVILKTLETIPENAILIYSDTGLLFREPIVPLLELSNKNDIILFEYDSEEKWGIPINIAKREIFKALDCDREQCHRGRHVWAGISVFRNTAHSRAFVKKWLDYCCDERLLTDTLDPGIEQHPEFDTQYHDEAILNVLYNKDPKNILLFPSKELFEKYATWHHRHDKLEDTSLLMATDHDRFSFWYILENDFLNNPLIMFVRKIFRSF